MKTCSKTSCKKEHDTKFKTCPACLVIAKKSRKSKKKRKREPKHCEENQCECTTCFNVKHVDEFKSKRIGGTTKTCNTCRDIQRRSHINPTTEYGKCKATYDAWKRKNPCEVCGISDCRVIEADHLYPNSKKQACSSFSWWTSHGGHEALKRELLTTVPKCCFCHAIKSALERGTQMSISILEKRKIINAEKLKRGCCLDCQHIVTEDTFCAFSFTNGHGKTSNIYTNRRGETSNIYISNLVYKPWVYFNEHIGIEMKKRDLLCANCFKIRKYY